MSDNRIVHDGRINNRHIGTVLAIGRKTGAHNEHHNKKQSEVRVGWPGKHQVRIFEEIKL
jgi:hypothetical protein